MTIAIVSSVLKTKGDEGVRNFAVSTGRALAALGHRVDWYVPKASMRLELESTEPESVEDHPVPKMAGPDRQPSHVIYFPNASLQVRSALRYRRIKVLWPGVVCSVVALQPTRGMWWKRTTMRRIASFDSIMVQSSRSARSLQGMGKRVSIIPSGVDRRQFTPATESQKEALRRTYSLPNDLPIVLHVGHIRESRNLLLLAGLQRSGEVRVIVVGSTSTSQDERLKRSLRRRGVRVIDTYQPRIWELYQLADCYVFPVVDPHAAIEFPLSILEALSSGIPVVSTPFGGVPDFLGKEAGVTLSTADRLVETAIRVVRSHLKGSLGSPDAFGWDVVARAVLRSGTPL